MLLIQVMPHERHAIITYPTEARLTPKTISCQSNDQALKKWEEYSRAYMIKMLKGWVRQRDKSFKKTKTLTGKRAAAVDKVQLMLTMHENSRLHVLCRRIVQDGRYFAELFPNKESKQYAFFKGRVAPILLWADEYRQVFSVDNGAGIKTV